MQRCAVPVGDRILPSGYCSWQCVSQYLLRFFDRVKWRSLLNLGRVSVEPHIFLRSEKII